MKQIIVLIAGVLAAALIVLGFWVWFQTANLVMQYDFQRPGLMHWAVRSIAVAMIALAQGILVIFVVGEIYARQSLDRILAVFAGLTCLIAMVCAISLSLAAR